MRCIYINNSYYYLFPFSREIIRLLVNLIKEFIYRTGGKIRKPVNFSILYVISTSINLYSLGEIATKSNQYTKLIPNNIFNKTIRSYYDLTRDYFIKYL